MIARTILYSEYKDMEGQEATYKMWKKLKVAHG